MISYIIVLQKKPNKKKAHLLDIKMMVTIMKGIIQSLNLWVGGNKENNLVLLTAREHFLVHWILVKRYKINSVERFKMLCAFKRMCFCDPNNSGKRKLNSRAFERYRLEYIQNMSKIMSELQKGEHNSQFGKSWYTNRNTGVTKKFKIAPDDSWINGRNLFKGESCVLKFKVKKPKLKIVKQKARSIKHFFVYSLTTLEKLKITDGVIPEGYGSYKNAWKNYKKLEAQKYWDDFHSGNYVSFKEFSKTLNITQPALTQKLKKYIPIYKILVKKRFDVKSDINLVGKYEQFL